jgi:hypothetical protein
MTSMVVGDSTPESLTPSVKCNRKERINAKEINTNLACLEFFNFKLICLL